MQVTFNQEDFRGAMARLGSAVSVVTTAGRAGKAGMTASAVCSVSDGPPTLLVCINRTSWLNQVVKGNGVFCVNTLSAGQEDLSALFAGLTGVTMEERFASARWHRIETGAPVLEDAAVSFDCCIAEVNEICTHSVLFGRVVGLRTARTPTGLIYFDRRYHPVGGTEACCPGQA